jgi:hypothetical protein
VRDVAVVVAAATATAVVAVAGFNLEVMNGRA